MTSRIGFLDATSGVSGDKFLGALLDAGTLIGDFTEEHLRAAVGALAPEARVLVTRIVSHGVAACGVRVEAEAQPHARTWADVRGLIGSADLPARARARALATFERIAIAESRVHGQAPEDVHFHEVGAIDSIVDVVGVCLGLDLLGVDDLTSSPLATGSGTVDTSHGILPVPAPATAALLIGAMTVPGPAGPHGGPAGELTTPTGAALVQTCASGYAWTAPPMVPELAGYGAGTRDPGFANVCRLLLGDAATAGAPLDLEDVVLLETNVDHLPSEALALHAEQLLAEGALDVWVTPIVMKKGRAALLLSVLVTPDRAEPTAARVVALTGSLGVRTTPQPRFVARRGSLLVETPWGPVRVKAAAGRLRPEHDDVARIVHESGLPYGEVVGRVEALAGAAGQATE